MISGFNNDQPLSRNNSKVISLVAYQSVAKILRYAGPLFYGIIGITERKILKTKTCPLGGVPDL